MQLNRKAMSYMWNHNKFSITITLFLVALGCLFRFIPLTIEGDNLLATLHNNLSGPIVALATLGIAFSVFTSENYQDWESSLPKRLTANFIHEGKLIMRCEDAYLSGEADIRMWAQQLGFQMANKENLNFLPNIIVSSVTGPVHLSSELLVKKYEAIFILREVPQSLLTKPERRSKFEEGLCLLWNTANEFRDEWKRFEIRDLEKGHPRIRPI